MIEYGVAGVSGSLTFGGGIEEREAVEEQSGVGVGVQISSSEAFRRLHPKRL